MVSTQSLDVRHLQDQQDMQKRTDWRECKRRGYLHPDYPNIGPRLGPISNALGLRVWFKRLGRSTSTRRSNPVQ